MSNINVSATNASNLTTLDVKAQVPVQKNEAPAEAKKETPKLEKETSSTGVASEEELTKTVNELNEKLANEELRVAFSMDTDSGHFVVKIHDSQTGELVRQIPSEETLKFAKNVEKGIGIIVDSKF
tara:strand:+ start:69 stop:446 length:378 start_codon:yes stop_codon:yes gene_type:complete